MVQEVMSPFVLNASLQGRAGVLALESNLNFLHVQTGAHDGTR